MQPLGFGGLAGLGQIEVLTVTNEISSPASCPKDKESQPTENEVGGDASE